VIVFLDFDGVLHGVSGPAFDERCISLLEASLAVYDAKVVIISSWKDELPLEVLTPRLRKLGARVIGACGEEPAFTKTPREQLVDDWLKLNEYDGFWIAVDDHPHWYGRHQGRVLATSSKTGFIEEDIERLDLLLGKLLLTTGMEACEQTFRNEVSEEARFQLKSEWHGVDAHKSLVLALRGQLALRQMIERAGGLLSEDQVAELLGLSPASVSEKTDHGGLLAVTWGGEQRYPAFQFVGGDIVPHLSEVLGLLDTASETAKLRFFVVEDADLGSNAAAALRQGRDLELVRRKARQFGRQVAK